MVPNYPTRKARDLHGSVNSGGGAGVESRLRTHHRLAFETRAYAARAGGALEPTIPQRAITVSATSSTSAITTNQPHSSRP